MKGKRLIFLAVVGLLVLPLFAEKTPFPGLSRFTLDNGLELFVFENHSAPLVYVEIAFRAGAYAQTPDTAGLFHLYEHMMFKGNAKYPTAAAVQMAMLDLGVASWNGSTGAERVNYYFTIPSDKVKEGLGFWASAVRDPLLDPTELATEIGVVTSEISGDISDPKEIVQSAIDKRLFPKFPWRRDSGGSIDVIKSCTVGKLRAIKDAYYVPNNAALFVGGDIVPEDALELVKAAYGTWKKGADPWAGTQETQAFPAVGKPTFMVYPDPNVSDRFGIASLYLRGPDVDTQPDPTYAADVFGSLSDDPDGPFKQAIFGNKDLAIPDPDYFGGFYWTQRDGGQIVFQAYMMTKSVFGFADRGSKFADAILKTEIPAIVSNPSYYSEGDFDLVKTIMEDKQILEAETVDGFLGSLSGWWSCSSTGYYFGYVPAMKKVGPAELAKYMKDFMTGNPPIVVMRVNPKVYEQQKAGFEKLGYEVITQDNAFWWKNQGGTK